MSKRERTNVQGLGEVSMPPKKRAAVQHACESSRSSSSAEVAMPLLLQLKCELVSKMGEQGYGDTERKAATAGAVTKLLLRFVAALLADCGATSIERQAITTCCANIERAVPDSLPLLAEVDFAFERAKSDLLLRRDVARDESNDAIVVAWLTVARRYFSLGSSPLPQLGVIANTVAMHMHNMHNT